MKVHSILAAALLLFGIPPAAAQDFTPAPVDLTGAPGLSAESGIQGYVDARGEFFLWNSYEGEDWVDSFTVVCEANCLDPTGHVDLRTQGLLHPEILEVYGPGLLDLGVAGSLSKAALSNLSLRGVMTLPPGPERAISLGRIVDAEAQDLLNWSSSGVGPIRLAVASGRCYDCSNLVQFAPEPSAGFFLAVLSACGAALTRIRRRARVERRL